MPEETYLFIDGEYLRRIYSDAIRSVFNCDGDLDFNEIKRQARATRAFVYDCLEEMLRSDGSRPIDYERAVVVDAEVKKNNEPLFGVNGEARSDLIIPNC